LVGRPSVAHDEYEYDPDCDREMVEEVHETPQTTFLAVFLNYAENVHQHDDDQRDPAQDCAVRPIIEWRID